MAAQQQQQQHDGGTVTSASTSPVNPALRAPNVVGQKDPLYLSVPSVDVDSMGGPGAAQVLFR